MIRVKLVNWGVRPPIKMASDAGLTCYSPEEPEAAKSIDVQKRLYGPGHHTTLQHSYFTFFVEGIAVGDVTFGLHLASPFYNSSQRSGRFCAEMFSDPDRERLMEYLFHFWPGLGKSAVPILNYVTEGIRVYQQHMPRATELVAAKIRKERPLASEKYIAANAPKIAQEQMRAFVPVLFPTALGITLNFTAIAAMYRVAWTPSMKEVVGKMAAIIVDNWPNAAFAFSEMGMDGEPWEFLNNSPHVQKSPSCRIYHPTESVGYDFFARPTADEIGPLDLLHFVPWLMDYRTEEVKDEVTISVATMGQDQRHRTIQRGMPRFTGGFYLPPIPNELGLEDVAKKQVEGWHRFMTEGSLMRQVGHLLAPYGAMVRYNRTANLAAAIHESHKRLCFCSQEEIYEVARQRREQLAAIGHLLVPYFSPQCISKGSCPEGVRCCGRDPAARKDNPFPRREV